MTKRQDLEFEDVMVDIRDRLDVLDREIVDMFVTRAGIIREAAVRKIEHGIPAVLPDRVEFVRERAADYAGSKGLSDDLVRQIYQMVIEYSCDLEEKMMADKNKNKKAV